MDQAAARMRDGLSQLESGAAALRALAEGKPPQEIALNWFKDQLNLPTAAGTAAPTGPLGLSWFHVIAMIFLAVFVVGTLLIHFARMRRISLLVARLANRPTGPTPPRGVPSSGPAGAPPPPGPSGTPEPPPATGSAATPRVALVPPASPAQTRGPRPQRWSGALRVAAIFEETHDTKTYRS
jgi:hypothetical protein